MAQVSFPMGRKGLRSWGLRLRPSGAYRTTFLGLKSHSQRDVQGYVPGAQVLGPVRRIGLRSWGSSLIPNGT
jgi:hypothetical protein